MIGFGLINWVGRELVMSTKRTSLAAAGAALILVGFCVPANAAPDFRIRVSDSISGVAGTVDDGDIEDQAGALQSISFGETEVLFAF